MVFHETKLPGVFEIDLEPIIDERGFFARSWCRKEFEAHGINARMEQCNISYSLRKGTLRGIHWQEVPFAENKLVRCTRGGLYDVVVDLRVGSSRFKQWIALELTATNRRMVYIPRGCAHGFLTLEDQTEVFYQMSEFHNGDSARGARWNDPAFQIVWPTEARVISERDRTYPDFEPSR
jgi:dTDP-4-dehydrorhamnose 3,5-epimerase